MIESFLVYNISAILIQKGVSFLKALKDLYSSSLGF